MRKLVLYIINKPCFERHHLNNIICILFVLNVNIMTCFMLMICFIFFVRITYIFIIYKIQIYIVPDVPKYPVSKSGVSIPILKLSGNLVLDIEESWRT